MPSRSRSGRGAAVVDVVLVLAVLVPVVLGIMQVALVLHVRNTLVAAASEGARLAATADRGPADGAALTRAQIHGAVSGRFAQDVSAQQSADRVEITVHARVPALGLGGPGIEVTVTGHAVEEPR
ncbi:MAG TPA: pilus assembly protein TadE [Nocardioides bacterium]|nr:pilus assembly protein TadE [Nocardioides sp.]